MTMPLHKAGRDDLGLLIGELKTAASPFRQHLIALHRKYFPLREGKVASYIPELARANPDWFAISAVTTSGQQFGAGDVDQQFTIQSVSKPFVYGLALEELGAQAVSRRVGVEPTGDAFNSLIRLDERSNRPHNPMVNAGAIATADLVPGADATERLRKLLAMFESYTGRQMHVDMAVFVSERSSGHRNRAIAHLMLNFDMISANVDETLDLYFQQCSILVNTQDLAMMAATLANGGVNPVTGRRALSEEHLRDVLSVMYTCGMYDYAGEWAYTVGIPAKSGVSGGILAVVPGRMGIAVFSPPLDQRGNSVRGIRVCEELSRDLGLHIFAPTSGRARELGV